MQGEMAKVPLIELSNAVVRRAGKDILSVDALAIGEGESLAVLGPNGAGKSTLVGLITRDISPLYRDEPPVLFRGQKLPLLTDVKMVIGYVSESAQEQTKVHLEAVEIVEGGLFGSLGVPKRFSVTEAQHQRALEVMEDLGILALAKRDVMTLSTGQMRRVMIARALVHNPSVLVFDEPCSGLDPQGMFHVRKTMRHIAQKGCSIVLVTHFMEDIIPEIDRVVMVKDGHIFADGSKGELLTSASVSQLFDIEIETEKNGEYYNAIMHY
jgi:iron complex transport system ATP-binding protein